MRHHLFHRFRCGGRHRMGRAGTAAIAALAASAWIAPAFAQPAQPPAPGATPPAQTQPGPGPMGGPGGPGPRGPMGGPMGSHWGGHDGPGWHHHGPHHRGHRGPFAGLIYPREDKQLTVAEVQKIAEAFLLWRGERDWKITNAHEAADNKVEFTLTTKEGGAIARFSMDRKTGRVQRIG